MQDLRAHRQDASGVGPIRGLPDPVWDRGRADPGPGRTGAGRVGAGAGASPEPEPEPGPAEPGKEAGRGWAGVAAGDVFPVTGID